MFISLGGIPAFPRLRYICCLGMQSNAFDRSRKNANMRLLVLCLFLLAMFITISANVMACPMVPSHGINPACWILIIRSSSQYLVIRLAMIVLNSLPAIESSIIPL